MYLGYVQKLNKYYRKMEESMRIQYHYCLENKWGLEKFLNTNEISYEKQMNG